MTRYLGFIGINRGAVETAPGIFTEVIDAIEVSGEMRQSRATWPQAGMRDGVQLAHVLSIVAPEDSDVDFNEVVYIEWQNHKWAVTQIQYKRPRVELSLGGLYDE